MASSPTATPAESGVSPANDVKTTAPVSGEATKEAPGAQESAVAASPSHTSPTREADEACAEGDRTLPERDTAEREPTDKDDEKDKTSKDDRPNDGAASPPPLPNEPPPDEQQQQQQEDDGWDPMWSDEHQAWYFYNRFTQQTQWDNPRVPSSSVTAAEAAARVAGGYNPAIHGDYDPTAWYATGGVDPELDTTTTAAAAEAGVGVDADAAIAAAAAAAAAAINQSAGRGHRSTHDAKASRQLNAYFDVAAASSEHDGRSLKAERSGKKPTKAELKAFKERRRAKKEEKRRAWLRD